MGYVSVSGEVYKVDRPVSEAPLPNDPDNPFGLAVRVGTVQGFISLTLRISVAPPQTGQWAGISLTPLRVRLSAIWGMIILAL